MMYLLACSLSFQFNIICSHVPPVVGVVVWVVRVVGVARVRIVSIAQVVVIVVARPCGVLIGIVAVLDVELALIRG